MDTQPEQSARKTIRLVILVISLITVIIGTILTALGMYLYTTLSNFYEYGEGFFRTIISVALFFVGSNLGIVGALVITVILAQMIIKKRNAI